MELRISVAEIHGQVVLVHLGTAIEHGRDEGNTDAASDVAGQIHQSGSRIVFLPRQVRIGCRINRYEEECQPCCLNHARNDHRAEVNLQVEVRHVEQGEGKNAQANHKKPAGVVLRQQVTDDWHEKHDREPTWHQRHPRTLSRVPQHGLHKEGQKQRAA